MTTIATAPGALPLIGHAARLLRPWSLLRSLPSVGGLVELRLGRVPVYVVCDPKLVHEMLVHDDVFDRGGEVFDQVRTIMGDGLITCAHAKHRRNRRLVQPVFSRSRMSHYGRVMAEHSAEVISSWNDGQILDVRAAMHTIIRRLSIAALFSSGVSPEQFKQLQDDVGVFAAGWLRRLITPAPLRRIAGGLAWDRAAGRVHTAIDDSITRARHAGCPVSENEMDVPAVLLGARDTDGGRFTIDQVHDELVSMFLAAVESSSTVLSWTLDQLSHHPEVQRRAAEEVDRVLKGRTPAWEDVERLPYITSVIHESMRMNPPTWLLTRVTARDTTLGGYPLPAGTTLAYSAYQLGRDPKSFPDPDRFTPDRWAGEAPPRGAFVPWGGGPRLCIGNTFSIAETVIVLAQIMQAWRLQPTRRRFATARVSMLHIPKSIRVRLHARQADHD
ncbi:cytochrome P450 [Amycolatopsis sp. cg5]|uniref:cytochrome P450 n=1 Tax=Amycolatopsis sp. cg5 TaxID=3238802 RepID=UPI0035259205